jgi:hypothetical protein
VQGVVPGSDARDDADRLAHDEGVADLLAVEVEGTGQSCEVAEVERRQPDLDHLREAQGHAHVVGDELADLVGPGSQRVRCGLQVVGALVRGQCRPAGEGCPGSGHGLVGVGGRALGNAGDELLGGRVEDVDRLAAGGVDPLATDVQLRAVQDRCVNGGHQRSASV